MRKILVSLLSVIMVACMAISLAACGDNNNPTPSGTPSAGTTATLTPSADPTANPTTDPTLNPTDTPPSTEPSANPTTAPSTEPSANPTTAPSTEPSVNPTAAPSTEPSVEPSVVPTTPGQNLYAAVIAAIEAGKYDNLSADIILGFEVYNAANGGALSYREQEYDYVNDEWHDVRFNVDLSTLNLGTKVSQTLDSVSVKMIRSGASFTLKMEVSSTSTSEYRRLPSEAITHTEGHYNFTPADGGEVIEVPLEQNEYIIFKSDDGFVLTTKDSSENIVGTVEYVPGTNVVNTDLLEEGTDVKNETGILYYTEAGVYVSADTLDATDTEADIPFYFYSYNDLFGKLIDMIQEEAELNVSVEDLQAALAVISEKWNSDEVQAAVEEFVVSFFDSFEMEETEDGYTLTASMDVAPIVNMVVSIVKLNGETPLYDLVNGVYLAVSGKEEGSWDTDLKAVLPRVCAFSVEDAFTMLDQLLAENNTTLDAVVEQALPYVNQILAMLPEGTLPEMIPVPMDKETALALIKTVRAQYGTKTVADLVELIANQISGGESSTDEEPTVDPSTTPSEEPAFNAVEFLSSYIDMGASMLKGMTIHSLIDMAGDGMYDMVTSFYAQKIEGTLTLTFDKEYRFTSATFGYEVNVGMMMPGDTEDADPVYSPVLGALLPDAVDKDGTLKGDYTVEIKYGEANITLPTLLLPNDMDVNYNFTAHPEKENLVVTLNKAQFAKVKLENVSFTAHHTDKDGIDHYSSDGLLAQTFLTVSETETAFVVTLNYQQMATEILAAYGTWSAKYENAVLDCVKINIRIYTSYDETPDAENNDYYFYQITVNNK